MFHHALIISVFFVLNTPRRVSPLLIHDDIFHIFGIWELY